MPDSSFLLLSSFFLRFLSFSTSAFHLLCPAHLLLRQRNLQDQTACRVWTNAATAAPAQGPGTGKPTFAWHHRLFNPTSCNSPSKGTSTEATVGKETLNNSMIASKRTKSEAITGKIRKGEKNKAEKTPRYPHET